MTPELEAELNRIGWQAAKHHPAAIWWRSKLTTNSGLVAVSPQLAKADLARHLDLCKNVAAVISDLVMLSEDARTTINLVSTPVDDRNGGWPDHVGATRLSLEGIVDGLAEWKSLLEHEAEKAGVGRQRNQPAYRIAEALSEIYFCGLGRMPTIGNRADGAGPSGLFGSAAGGIFTILGVQIQDVVPPCKAAISKLTPDRIKTLKGADPRNSGIFPSSRGVQ